MLFNSIQFIYFLPIVVLFYFIAPYRFRWLVLLLSSYYFYVSWNANYLVLILFTTMVSYFSAIQMERSKDDSWRKFYLILSIFLCLVVLFFFKYYNFFGENINFLINNFQLEIPYSNFLLPVGISFYTFQTLSYTIDVYQKKQKVEYHFGIYALYVSFFPQLVAGPIERSYRLLPQFKINQKFTLNNLLIGLRWLMIGFFMKLVVADRLSLYVDSIYNNAFYHSGSSLALATIFFAFQIYCDFAGYSNIAIGSAKIMGYDLMVNFKRPYFSISFSEFWKRWHISLSSWFRDYFYIPIGGNRVNVLRNFFNIMLTFLVSGLWHGANWTFVVWGALHALYLIIEIIFKLEPHTKIPIISRILRTTLIFISVCFAWVFFRANNINEAFHICNKIIFDKGEIFISGEILFFSIVAIFLLIINDFLEEYVLKDNVLKLTNNGLVAIYFAIIFCLILFLGVFNGGQFIYFQF